MLCTRLFETLPVVSIVDPVLDYLAIPIVGTLETAGKLYKHVGQGLV